MQNTPELLAPGGDIKAIKAAILAGVDAVYCGLDKFNARNRAQNITFDHLIMLIPLAHQHNCKIFLTLNILILEHEIPAIIKLLNKLQNTALDGIIVQDLGLFYLLKKYFPSISVHASTQCTTHNSGQIKFLARLSVSRVNLSRELNAQEIQSLVKSAKKEALETEVFIHGSFCIAFSGLCYMSSVLQGKSGNRGLCSQPCRAKYLTTKMGTLYPLNLKDNSLYLNLRTLINTGVNSLKIEGRIKPFEYVYRVVRKWRHHLDYFFDTDNVDGDTAELYKIFNRDFTDGYFTNRIGAGMFIDNPMDHCLTYFRSQGQFNQQRFLADRKKFTQNIKKKTEAVNSEKTPLKINVSGHLDAPLTITLKSDQNQLHFQSEKLLEKSRVTALKTEDIQKRLKAINKTPYFIDSVDFSNFHSNLSLPFRELTLLKNKILSTLLHIDNIKKPVRLPQQKEPQPQTAPQLSVLISSISDYHTIRKVADEIYFKLPSQFNFKQTVSLFNQHTDMSPYFPAILIGDHYTRAKSFLQHISPRKIITDNIGILYESGPHKAVAGPYLNSVNSYSLISLKEIGGARGAFISNELSQHQLKSINRPTDFHLYYSIYQPILLMITRQCLFQTTIGCTKTIMDDQCLADCKRATIFKSTTDTYHIEKKSGHYHELYHDSHYLNLAVISDFWNKFTHYFVDLRKLPKNNCDQGNSDTLLAAFRAYIEGNHATENYIKKQIHSWTNQQYKRGI